MSHKEAQKKTQKAQEELKAGWSSLMLSDFVPYVPLCG